MSGEDMLDAALDNDAGPLTPDVLRAAIASLLERCHAADTPEACAAIWLQLEAIADDARTARDEAGEWTAKVMGSVDQYRTEVAGTRIVRKRRQSRKSWDKDRLLTDVVALVPENGKLNTDTGEVEPERWTTLRLLRECVSLGGGLQRMKNYGLSADDYCQTTSQADTVEVEHA